MFKQYKSKLTAIIIIAFLAVGTFSYVNYLISKPLKILKNYTIPTEFIHNDTKIDLAWTDNNEGETLIIQSDKKEYDGFSSVDVYFSITNISEKDQNMDVVVWVGSEKVKVKNINKLNENQKTTSKEMVLSASTGVSAGIVNPNNSITDEKNLSSPNTLKDVEAPGIEPGRSGLTIPTSQPATPTSDLLYNNSKLASNLDRKSVNGFEIGYFVNDNIESGNTNYYKATIKYPPMSKGEFFIEAFGEAEPLRFALANRRGSASSAYGHLDPWYSSNWNYKREITINASQISTTTSNFPVLATTTLDDLKTTANGGKVESDNGYDIIFVDDDDSTIMNFEREYYDSATGKIVYWIKTDISSTTDKTIYMYYGNSSASDLATTTGVWDDNFVMVQHMNEDWDASSTDSTKYDNDGIHTNFYSATSSVDAQIDGGIDFNGVDDYVIINDEASLNIVSGTVEAWIRYDISLNQTIVMKKEGEYDTAGWVFYISVADSLRFYSSGTNYGFSNAILCPNSLYHVVVVFDSGIATFYINSVDETVDSSIDTLATTTKPFYIGKWKEGYNDYAFNGIIDEVRISNVARTAGWIKTEYNNQSDVGAFMTIGAEENSPPVITSVTDSPDPAQRSSTITFSVDWDDNPGENIKVKICKTDSLTNQNCDGGHYASSTVFTTDDPEEVTYAIQMDDTAGNYDYYAFVCDDDGNCSGSTHGTFAIKITQINTPHTNKWTDGLIGYWSFDGADMDWGSSTAEALDRSGQGNNGDVKNGAKSAIGKVGQAMEFDGSDDYVDVPDADNLDVTGVTLSAWVKSDTAGRYIIAKDPPALKLRRASLPESGNYKDVFKEGHDFENIKKETFSCEKDSLSASSADMVSTFSVVDHPYNSSIAYANNLSSNNYQNNIKAAPVDRVGLEPAFPRVINHGAYQLAERPIKSGLLDYDYNIDDAQNKNTSTDSEDVLVNPFNRDRVPSLDIQLHNSISKNFVKFFSADNYKDVFKREFDFVKQKAIDFANVGKKKISAWFGSENNLQEVKNLECLVKTSDNIFSNIPKEEWTEEMFAKERRGNAKQGYIMMCKDTPAKWGKLETDPSRFAIVKIKKSEFNEEWLSPEYDLDKPILDKDGKETGEYEIKTLRKHTLPLENFLSATEINDLRSIEYNSLSDWSLEKTIDNIANKIAFVDYKNRPADMKLHGSSGTFTICPSSCDYTNLFNWEAGEQADLTGTGPCIAEITEGFLDNTAVAIDGWTTTVNDYIKIYTTSAARHDGKWDNGAYRLETAVTYGNLFKSSTSNVKVDGLQIYNTSVTDCFDMTYSLAITGQEISNCIVKTIDDGNGIWILNTGITIKIWNTIVYNIGAVNGLSEGIFMDNSSVVDIYNCTINGYGQGIEQDTGTVTVANTVSFGNIDDFDGTMTITTSASDDADIGTIQPADWSTVFEDHTAFDFHLKSTDTDLQSAGTDDPGSGLYSDDIDGDVRTSTWDIGADEVPPKTNVPYALSTVAGGQFLIMNNSTTYTATATTDINDNEWHHIVGSYGGTTMKIYIDGTLEDANTDFSGNLPIVDGNMRIGADYQPVPDNFFNGLIDEARIYNRALSADEIAEQYRVGARKLQANTPITNYLTDGLVGHWTFNGSDMDWASTTAEALDMSGQGNHGDVIGATAAIGKVGQGLEFDGDGDYADIGNVYNSVKTVNFWIKADGLTKKIIDLNGTVDIEIVSGTITANNFSNTIYVDGAVSSVIDTDWHYVAIATGTAINVNAVDIGRIGAGYFDGILDEVRIYNRALSADEIGQLYRIGARKMGL